MDILIVDDHEAMREEVCSLLEDDDRLRVVGQASGGKDGVRLAVELKPDVIVMDVVMPDMNGIEATRQIHELCPGIRVLALSNHTGRDLIQAMLKAGAGGYVRKDRAYEELIPAIHALGHGEKDLCMQIKE